MAAFRLPPEAPYRDLVGYALEAFLAPPAVARQIAAEVGGTRAVDLYAQFALVPLGRNAVSALSPGDEEVMSLLTAQPLPERLADLLRRVSLQGPVAYVEADFFGGIGTQGAIVFDRGEVVFGPVVDPRPVPVHPSQGRAINQALRMMGVDRGSAVDEFAALDLGRHGETAEWLTSS